MREPTSTTALGRTLEDDVAKAYSGQRSASSGAADGRKGDVRFTIFDVDDVQVWTNSYDYLAECKTTRAKSIRLHRDTWLKVEQEARQAGLRPTMFIRLYGQNGEKHIDLVVRSIDDDLEMLK